MEVLIPDVFRPTFLEVFPCPRDFGSHAEAPFAVTFMTREISI